MGVWGFYDNQNDAVLDEFITYQLFFIKKNNKKLYSKCKNNKFAFDENIYNEIENYIEKNIVKAAKCLKLYIDKLNKENFISYTGNNYDNTCSIITGLIVELLYVAKSPRLQKKLPKTLFNNFPMSLKKIACMCIKESLENVQNELWSDSKKRINALKQELKLFECVSNKKIDIKDKKIRKSPSESATKFNVGEKKQGNDGNIWIIIETKNNIKRWKKL